MLKHSQFNLYLEPLDRSPSCHVQVKFVQHQCCPFFGSSIWPASFFEAQESLSYTEFTKLINYTRNVVSPVVHSPLLQRFAGIGTEVVKIQTQP